MDKALFILDKAHELINKLWGHNTLTNIMIILMFSSLSWVLIDKVFTFLTLFGVALLKIKAKTDYKELHISINEGENKDG